MQLERLRLFFICIAGVPSLSNNFQVLQQIKNLDFAKLRLSDGSLTDMKELTAMLSQLTASLREEGTLVDSAHLEVHLLLILKSLGKGFWHRHPYL